ncbi:MAG TPA: hypothetical protein VD763_00035 [Candidatus Saccharimonadales bacterium]|nr:hypothetical protein [Candidatus Saccharimonadales bacterium]
MTTTRRVGSLAALSIAGLLLVACGGATATTPPDGASPAPTTAGEVTPPPVGALPSFDLGGLVQSLDGVDSYRVSISVDGAEAYRGVVVTKPVLSRDVTIVDGTEETRLVVVGDEAWMGKGDALQPVPAELAGGMLAAFDPTLLVAAFSTPGAMTGAADLGTEEKNGVQAKHFQIDSTSFVGALASLPPGAKIDLWVAEAGYLVSLETTGVAGGGFGIDVSGVNDPANVVERPD